MKHALRDLTRGPAARFDRAMEPRYADAVRVRRTGGGELVFAAIEPWPSSYFRSDVEERASELRTCVARWFRVDSIRIEEAPAGR